MTRNDRYRWGRWRLPIATIVAGLGVCAGTFASPAFGLVGGGDAARSGSVQWTLDSRVTPTILSARGGEPATLRLGAKLAGEGPPPTTHELRFDLDRDVSLNLGRYPAYPVSAGGRDIRGKVREELARCGSSMVGSGTIGVDVSFEEVGGFQIRRPLTVYKVRVDERPPGLIAFLEFSNPIPGEMVVPIDIAHPNHGPYGTRASMTIPKIANGAGSVTSFSFHIGKGVGYRHTRRSLVTARCSDGGLRFAALASFYDGSEALARSSSRCVGISTG